MALIPRRETRFSRAEPVERRLVVVPDPDTMISFGWVERPLEHVDPRSGETTIVHARYRLLTDRLGRRPKWIQWEGGQPEALMSYSETTTVRSLGVVRTSGRTSGRHAPAQSDRRVPIDEYQG